MTVKDGRIKDDQYTYMVLGYGKIDLAHMLSQKWKEVESLSLEIDDNWLRFYWQQMLEAINTIHEERIVHSDLKPANSLFVRGSLKLIDFGIAKAILSDTTNIQRDAQRGHGSLPEIQRGIEKEEGSAEIKSTSAQVKLAETLDLNPPLLESKWEEEELMGFKGGSFDLFRTLEEEELSKNWNSREETEVGKKKLELKI
ncbi:probable serine/threonine-protein kinase MPS1 homolog [Asparagus officinalis]|uniref:probable serine/threonine-protein kinase MPS1 homolog n=1 Tax=Asparagus officinalis TaxID=4686 RepID=UPI00098E4AFD|nr:probable serine/threonine-protein kinase MPS1 homolog [Asparagus officinalis]